MPPVVIAAGIAAAGVTAGAVISKSASDKQADAAKEAAKAGSDSHTTAEEVTHKLPVESGAATAQGYGLASDFDQAQAAALGAGNEQGIDFGNNLGRGRGALASTEDMGGLGSGNAPDREGEYASIQLMKKTTDATRLKVKFLGIDDGSGANPGGVKMSQDEYITLQRLKDPSVLIHNGTSLTDPVADDELVGSMSELVPGYASMSAADQATWNSRYSLMNMMAQDPQMSGDTLAAMAENDPTMASAIAYWKGKGAIDKMNNQNAGQISKIGQKITKTVVEDRVMTPLTAEEKQKYADQYDAATKQVADPKNVKVEHVGNGMTRTTVLNADGSTAMQTLDGNITLPTGQQIPVTMAGSSGKDFQAMQDMADQTGGLFADAAAGKHSSGKKKPKAAADDTATTDDPSAAGQPDGYTGADLAGSPGGDAETSGDTSAEGGMEEPGDTSMDPNADPSMDPSADDSSMASGDVTASADTEAQGGISGDMTGAGGGLSDPMMPGTPGTSSYDAMNGDSSGQDTSSGGGQQDMEAELNTLITKIPKKYQKKVANFWMEALDQDPTLTTKDLVGMLPDELQAGLNQKPIKKGKGPMKRPGATGGALGSTPGKKSKDLDALLKLLQDHPELATNIMQAIQQAQDGAA